MQKLSLITLHSVQNYGSALQTYASQLYFQRMGYDVEVVDFTRENNLKENIADTALRNSGLWNRNFLTRAAFKIIKESDLKKRYEILRSFIDENICLTPHKYLSNEDFERFPIEADIYCTGSDQTWNTYWNRGFILPYYLFYAKPGAKKIAYSASFGMSELKEDEKEKTYELLSSYDFITVREQTGVDILADLGIDAQRILDPTLMIEKSDWLSLAPARKISDKYMLVYQLAHNPNFDKLVKRIAEEKGLKVIRIGFGKEAYLYAGKVILNPSVLDFLSLLANAEYIITDSFHATSFAVNLNIDFFVWLPKAFTSRITDFLGIVGLENRVFDDYDKLQELFQEEIDFESVNKRLNAERKRCHETVEKMIKGKTDEIQYHNSRV